MHRMVNEYTIETTTSARWTIDSWAFIQVGSIPLMFKRRNTTAGIDCELEAEKGAIAFLKASKLKAIVLSTPRKINGTRKYRNRNREQNSIKNFNFFRKTK